MLVVQQQDGTYDWGHHVDEQASETRAFMAEITEEMGLSEELVQIISGDNSEVLVRQQDTEEQSSEGESTDSDDTAPDAVDERLSAGVQGETSESFTLKISEDMTVKEIVSYMADLKTPSNNQVSFNLQHLVHICTNYVQVSDRKSVV